MLPGVYPATRKNGSCYFRSSITFQKKHISLGSFSTEREAHQAFLDATWILSSPTNLMIQQVTDTSSILSFPKMITLLNFRDNHIYFKTPIYMRRNYFEYYLSETNVLKFDLDELFFYSTHTIMKRQNHLFVSDYGMQITIMSRYGIRPFAVSGRDFFFLNEDTLDFRSSNLKIVNPYHGVTTYTKNHIQFYRVKIHINGDYLVGQYRSEKRAAIAYNKAADLAKKAGIQKNFPLNFVEECLPSEYAEIYSSVKISNRYLNYLSGIKKD